MARAARGNGFTLIELIITIAIAAILLAIAIPSFRTTILNNRRASSANDFVSVLTYARSIALARHATVTVCRTGNPTASRPSCGGTPGWETGWVAFVESSSGTTGFVDTADEILRQHEALNALTLHGGTGPASLITFNSSGLTTQSGRLALCDVRGWTNDARVVLIGAAGQVRVVPKAEDPSATALTSCSPP